VSENLKNYFNYFIIRYEFSIFVIDHKLDSFKVT
jgi:hypothetical protein